MSAAEMHFTKEDYESAGSLQEVVRRCDRDLVLDLMMESWAKPHHDAGNMSEARWRGMRAGFLANIEDMSSARISTKRAGRLAITPWDMEAARNLPWEDALSLPVYMPKGFSSEDLSRIAATAIWEMVTVDAT